MLFDTGGVWLKVSCCLILGGCGFTVSCCLILGGVALRCHAV